MVDGPLRNRCNEFRAPLVLAIAKGLARANQNFKKPHPPGDATGAGQTGSWGFHGTCVMVGRNDALYLDDELIIFFIQQNSRLQSFIGDMHFAMPTALFNIICSHFAVSAEQGRGDSAVFQIVVRRNWFPQFRNIAFEGGVNRRGRL
jgi:hypothetical protein